jgi:hypothetical protein
MRGNWGNKDHAEYCWEENKGIIDLWGAAKPPIRQAYAKIIVARVNIKLAEVRNLRIGRTKYEKLHKI